MNSKGCRNSQIKDQIFKCYSYQNPNPEQIFFRLIAFVVVQLVP